MGKLEDEIKRRRTFAIISHPDAGKTTLTEKFLLYGGAIAQAGAVKGKKNSRHAVSDWMEIEKQRGISVTSSVMQFQYKNYCINILDTPGHQDFSEDTYRTLMAADSAVMVIDASKGVENQTRKLFKVCVMRHIPIFTFVNKMDRESRNPFDLMEQIESELGIQTYPVNWPIGSGKEFKGVYDRDKKHIISFEASGGQHQVAATEGKFDKDMEVLHVQGNKKLRLSQPQQIMAQEREIIDEAYAGDIIGVFDPGIFAIGDTICSPKKKFEFESIPTFAPEHFMRVRQKDTLKRKQFVKGTTQIAQEGAIQIFHEPDSGIEEVIVGVVGVLQLEVFEYRMKNEYNVDLFKEGLPYSYIRWIDNKDIDPKTLKLSSDTKLVKDFRDNYLLLFTSEWNIRWALERNEGLELSEFNRGDLE